jgi:guanylate kinase
MSSSKEARQGKAATPHPGILFVVSAPSGAGKTTLCKEIVDFFPSLRQSVSFTTRPARAGEIDGVDYHFVDAERFRAMVAAGEFAEWAEVHGNYYGTALSTLHAASRAGEDVLLDIDCQGARQLKDSVEQAVYIFILPPDMAELERRLRGRNTDSEEVIRCRLDNAKAEIAQSSWYDYQVINDNIDQSLGQLKTIFQQEMARQNDR